MELNQKVIEDLSSRLKVDKSEFVKALTDETIEKLDLSVEVLTIEEKTQLETNIEKRGYDKGKLAEKEMTLKNLKKSKGLEIEANTLEELFDKHSELIKSTYSGDSAKSLKEKDDTILKLQKTIEEKENEKNQIEQTYSKKFKENSANQLIQSQITKIAIDVPEQIKALGDKKVDEYIEAKQKQYFTIFKAQYEVDFDETSKPIFKVGNEVLKNNIENPLTIDEVMNKFAKENFIEISTGRTGRGDGSSKKSSGGNLKGMSLEELEKYSTEKGIVKNSKAYDEIYLTWKKANE